MDDRITKFGVPVTIGLVSFGAGIGLGYLLGRRRRYAPTHIVPAVKKDFSVMEQEIEHTLEYYEKEEEKGRHPSSISTAEVEEFVAEKLKESAVEPDDSDEIVSETRSDGVTHETLSTRLFAESDEDWDYTLELSRRKDDQPYILHKDEFFADERGYTQTTLTYYAGDDIMVDEDESPVYMHAHVVGELIFGHGSGDPNVVYVRNTERKAEYEILFDPGLYSIEVLGLEIENNQRVKALKHEPPKFRRNE